MDKEQIKQVDEQYMQRLFTEIKDVRNKAPILLVGGAVPKFKKMYKGNIYKVTTLDEARDFVANFYGLTLDKPVVMEDISLLSYDAQFLLLKLVEEARFPIVLLTLQDKVSPIILSRIKTYMKFPLDYDIKCNGMDIAGAQEELDKMVNEEKISLSDTESVEKFYAENCPELLYLEKNIGYVKNKAKYIEIMKDIKEENK